ncbi:MAG TPA: LacI family DNA-binding transcriptional regulator [Opitutaceae bacterium]
MPAYVRLKDIAARARVSTATVSMALRDNKLISEATRARILALAHKMGYQAHPYVSAYMSWRRTRGALTRPTIALLHNYATSDGWRGHGSTSLREMHRGALEQIRLRGYGSEEFWLQSARPARLVEILQTRAIGGLIFAPIAEKTQSYEFPWEKFSAVQIGAGPAGLKLPRIAHDHYQSALEAVRRCAQRKYRRPGLVIDRAHDARLQHVWRAGFEMGVEECGFTRNMVLQISEAEPDPRGLKSWLKRMRPDVIVTNLHGYLESMLEKLGLAVPRNVGLVSLSVPALNDRVTGIDQHGYLIGTQAVDVVAAALQLHRTGVLPEAITTLVAGRWNPGQTF